MTSLSTTTVGGPFYEDIRIGDRFAGAPAVTLTDGLAAAHQAIVGGRLHLAHDRELAWRVTGTNVAPPALVWDVSIGQSTLVTQRAIANLFYRGLAFRALPAIGETLKTTTTIVGTRAASARPGRPPRGLVVMRIVTTAQDGRTILDFHRCAMIAARSQIDGAASGELEPPEAEMGASIVAPTIAGWDLAAFRAAIRGPHFADIRPGMVLSVEGGDVVTSAPELARLTLNLAAVHHDSAAAGGRRLVYGGHTIGLAAAQVSRAFPALVTILGWRSCDHTGPVHEGDTLHSEIGVEACEPLPAGGGLVHLRSWVRATPESGDASDVLDWRLVALFA